MPTLPTSGLETLAPGDHIDHHEAMHAINNAMFAGTSDLSIGEVVTRIASGTAASAFASRSRHYTLNEQCLTVTHSTAGALTFSVLGRHRAVKINASANITGLAISGMDLAGPQFAEINCLLVATANITIAMGSGATVVGSAPTSMTTGQSVPFLVQRWNF